MPWETVIGLEIHTQLATQSKIFSGAATAFNIRPELLLPSNVVYQGAAMTAAVVTASNVVWTFQLTNAVGGLTNADDDIYYDDLPPGAGEFQGGIGVVKAQRVLTPAFITHESERHGDAPWGIFGGQDGTVGRCTITNPDRPGDLREMHSKFSGLAVEANDVMTYYSPNGGGYGDPLNRPPLKVLDDVLDGFCTLAQAREAYGVIVDPDAETVDIAATERLRAAMRKAG